MLEVLRTKHNFTDMYNSDTDFIGKKMDALTSNKQPVFTAKRNDRDENQHAQYFVMREAGTLSAGEGSNAPAQPFVAGDVVVKVGDKIHKVDRGAFIASYKKEDGTKFNDKNLPTGNANDGTREPK